MALRYGYATLNFSGRRRRWLLLLAAAGISSYGAYRIYHLPSVSKKREKLVRLLRALISIAEAASSAADAVNLVSTDLNRFLRSDSGEIPKSLRQISKIARSEEFSCSVSRVFEALTVGIIRGFAKAESTELEPRRSSSSFSDRLLDKLLSNAGSGFASVVVGSFARNLVIGFYSRESAGELGNRTAGVSGLDSESPAVPEWVRLICDDKCRELIADSIQGFVSTAVTVYLEKTMAINAYEEIFSALTNPKHEAKVKDVLVSVCNGAVESLVKTSHQVMTTSSSNSSLSSTVAGVEAVGQKDEVFSEKHRRSSSDKKLKGGSGWVDHVSSTSAVPSNRRFVLDVTGRVTFETVRSFLEFLLLKLYNGARSGFNVVREEVVERGLEVVRYVSAKSMAIFTMCVALCLHVSIGARLLMPA
ncbi:protein PHLOEM PROTEIN 2-LIKE A10 [Elaeis guineensis]|uniref:protein PHLOEM PROTEIN 2-LIKE A10 n=1 Tax=Elaeis guineensis var. tenera TaxID=51953 RepID=UPI003C6D9380